MTDTTITTRVALAVIDVNLTAVTSETNRAYTSKRVDQIVAYTTIQAWIQLTLVNVNLTLCARETCNSAHFSTYCYHQWRNHCNPKWIQVLQLNQIYRVLILSTVTSCPKCHSFTERASHKLLSLHKKPKLFFIYPHYQLPHKRILFEKLLPVQLVTKSLAFYGTHKFLAAFTRACQWSTAWVRWVLSTPPHPFLTIHHSNTPLLWLNANRFLLCKLYDELSVCHACQLFALPMQLFILTTPTKHVNTVCGC